MNERDYLSSLSDRISDEILNLEIADKTENPDLAIQIRSNVQDRLQELVIEINLRAGM